MNNNNRMFPLTDQGNSERFAAHWKGRLIYVSGIGWFIYDGKRWKQATRGEYIECAKKTVRAMYLEAKECPNEEYRIALAEFAVKCESEKRIMAMIRLAQSDPTIAVLPEQLDADQYVLNINNGMVDLRTLKLLPHDPLKYCTKLAPVTYDPAARCSVLLAFADRVFANNQSLITYVQRVAGHTLTGDASSQHVFIFWGEGANGKSTFMNILMHILGEYAGMAPDTLLMSGRNEHPTELADLQGLRLANASETPANAKWNIQRMKQLTGENMIKARKMHGNYYQFPRTHKLILQTNNKPRVTEDSEAVWRRIRCVPWNVVIPEPERDPYLLEKLKAESSGILNWLLIGCLEWQKEGLAMPDAVADATRHYREESDPIADFLNDCCTIGADIATATGTLRQAYENYCKAQGLHPIGGRAFAQRLEKLGCTAGRNHSGRFWNGVGVVENAYSEAGSVTP